MSFTRVPAAACSGFGRPRTTTVVFAEGPLWMIAPARLAAATASLRRLLRMPVKARWTPFQRPQDADLERGGRVAERLDHFVGAFVPLPPLADAAIDDLLQVIGARQAGESHAGGSASSRRP